MGLSYLWMQMSLNPTVQDLEGGERIEGYVEEAACRQGTEQEGHKAENQECCDDTLCTLVVTVPASDSVNVQ